MADEWMALANSLTEVRDYVDIRVGQGATERLSGYLSKLTFEAAGGRFKVGREGGRTPFELLDAAVTDAGVAGLTGPVEGTVAQAQAVVAGPGRGRA